jgi:serine protease inhibitor
MKPAVVLVPLLFAACAAAAPTRNDGASNADHAQASAPAQQTQQVALANRAFGVELYKRLAAEQGNVFISPISLAGAFGPVTAGAQGETRAAIGRVLHFPADDTALHGDLGQLLQKLETDTAGSQVSIANGLWLMKGFAVRPAFVSVATTSYGAEVESLDFRNGAAAAQRINSWVERETKGRIPKLIEPSSLDEMTALVVTNAVHFLGDWAQPFNASSTSPQPFYLAGGTTREVPLMYGKRYTRYAETDGVQLLELPYKSDRLSMIAVLPKERNGLPSVERKLDDQRVGAWLQQLASAQPVEVRVHLPKVELRTSYQLVDPLKAMGMAIAFDPDRADFGGIADRQLFISQVVHKTFLRMDEKGTEAAAATGVEIELTSAPSVPPPTFRADHPFLVLIRDNRTGAVLFMGRIAEPSAR